VKEYFAWPMMLQAILGSLNSTKAFTIFFSNLGCINTWNLATSLPVGNACKIKALQPNQQAPSILSLSLTNVAILFLWTSLDLYLLIMALTVL
jgi:hypothetical protein